MSETHQFKAEINQLLSLIINSFYSKPEIAIRELVSNASDALDKARYNSIEDKTMLNDESKFEINIKGDTKANTLTIHDTGIGMSKEELVNNLGTIAKSGTKAFMEAMKNAKDSNLIGQFGVGFYSGFLIASHIEVYSRKKVSDKIYKWSSDATNKYVLEEAECDITRGTKIVLHLKEDKNEFADDTRLKDVLLAHSSYINFPINLYTKRTKEVTEEVTEEDGDDNKENEVVDVDDDGNVTDKPKTKSIEYFEYAKVNTHKPIWTRKESEVTKEEYHDFYKNLTLSYDDPLCYNHFKVEGALDFSGILFIPKNAPVDMFKKTNPDKSLKLFVKRVFITDDCKDLIPDYLTFLRGLIDSNDLPLNVSREILQKNKGMQIMKKHIVKKAIEMLTEYSKDEDKYLELYKEYSNNIKLGVHEDEKNRSKLIELLRFYTLKHMDKPISLKEYVNEMKEGQNSIYYLTGESLESLKDAPFLEALKAKDYDTILMTDAVDEYCVMQIKEYMDKTLVCVSKEGLKLDEEKKDDETKHEELFKFVKETLKDNVDKVTLSHSLIESPCSIVTSSFGWTANLQRVIKTQTLSKNPMAEFMKGKKNMELNCNHKLIKQIEKDIIDNTNETRCRNLVLTLYQTALLTSGFTIDKPVDFVNRVHKMLETAFVDEDSDEEDMPPLEIDGDETVITDKVNKMDELD